jgi:prepilin-type N-terminal cleavage/methylation domain-containing protein
MPRGFTMVEMIISVFIASLIFLMLNKLFIGATRQHQIGFANLATLEEARLAISWIRRDFSTACPYLSAEPDTSGKDPESEFAAKNIIRRTLFKQDLSFVQPESARPGMNTGQNQSFPIQYSRDALNSVAFYRFEFGSSRNDLFSRVETVEYWFDPAEKCLVRRAGAMVRKFQGMEAVEFKFFTPEWSNRAVMLRIRILVRNSARDPSLAAKPASAFVQIVSTVNSRFISSNLSDPYWNYESYQKRL